MYLGLDNGYLEEHHLVYVSVNPSPASHHHHHHKQQQHQQQIQTQQQPLLRLQAEKKVFSKAIKAIVVAPAAARMALLSEDGQVSILKKELLCKSCSTGAKTLGYESMTAGAERGSAEK